MTDDEFLVALTAIARSSRTNQDAHAAISRLIEQFGKLLQAQPPGGGVVDLSNLVRKINDAVLRMPADGKAQARMHHAVAVLWERGVT
jgi:hypothetical protein